MLKRTILIIVIVALLVWSWFTVAGRWDWMQGWAYLAITIGDGRVSDIILWRRNPDLVPYLW